MNKENIVPFISTPNVFNHMIRLLLDVEGNIVSILNAPGTIREILFTEPLEIRGNIRRFFDMGQFKRLDEIPGLTGKTGPDQPPHFFNIRNALRLEEPEAFYTLLPVMVLYLFGLDKNTYLGLCRPVATVPNFSLEGMACLVYVDRQDRLTGFNQAFLNWLDKKPDDPFSLLGTPVDRFFSPKPSGIQKKQMDLHPVPRDVDFKESAALDFSRKDREDGISCSNPDMLRATPEGVLCRNKTADTLFLNLPVTLDSRDDFRWSLDADTFRGTHPLFAMGRQNNPRNTPDSEGYLIGPHSSRAVYMLKRRAFLHVLGENMREKPPSRIELCKSGNALRLFVAGRLKLAYYDFEFLSCEKTVLAFAVRAGSECLFRRTRISTRTPPHPDESLPPQVRFAGSGQVAVLRHITNLAILSSFPEISAYLLENVTRIQHYVASLEKENRRLQDKIGPDTGDFISRSPAMAALKANASRVAPTDAAVLLEGPTGSGKEVVARFIHEKSLRKDKPFIKVDCSVLSPSLIESELFGHEKGSFTGAGEKHTGYFERAQGGTLFLDEAGNLPPAAQAKLLHFLQDHVITRVGGRSPMRLDVRVIVASNIPLKEMVEKGLFREDLYYRIDVVNITLPRLRDRREDLPELCRHFIGDFAALHKKEVRSLSPGAFKRINAYGWPGNVRELRNVLERAVLFTDSPVIEEAHLSFSGEKGRSPDKARKPYRLINLDAEALKSVVQRNGGNLRAAARELGVSRQTLYYKMSKSGLDASVMRKG